MKRYYRFIFVDSRRNLFFRALEGVRCQVSVDTQRSFAFVDLLRRIRRNIARLEKIKKKKKKEKKDLEKEKK